MKVILNGKFLRAPMTGVHRVAQELGNALADMAAARDPAVDGLQFEVWYPHDGAAQAGSIRLPGRQLGPFTSIPWEQLTLPLAKGNSLLLNLCNIGPPLARDAITMVHDVQVHLSPGSYSRGFRLWYHTVQPAFARRHRLLLTVSEFSKAEIVRVGLAPAERIRVVPNGVDHVLRTAAETAILGRLGLEPQRYAVALSTTQAHKNIGLLLRAFAAPEMAGLKLVLFGSGRPDDFQAAGHTLSGNIVFAGRVSDGELRALLEAALALPFPSTTEGFGLPPMEAMLLGCPALVTPCGALPEVVGSAAPILSETDPEPWRRTLLSFAADPALRSRWAQDGQRRAAQFTWDRAARILAAALQEVRGPAIVKTIVKML
ncbi:MAG: glycosyltransferase family 4 protein [Sandaracinobacteroides sp.]